MLTLGEVKESSILNIVGKCGQSSEFTDYLNDATRRLMRRGDWVGTEVPIHVCVQRGCVVFPRYVGTVRKVNWCHRPLAVNGLWYSFLNYQHSWPWNRQTWYGSLGGECGLQQSAQSPVFTDIFGDGRLVRAYPQCQADIGKTVKLFGVDNNNQTLMERDSNNNWVEGVTLTLDSPFVSTSMYVRRIDRLLKQPTQCPVRLYAYYATDDVLEDIGYYEPSEVNPSFARYQLQFSTANFNGVPTASCVSCANQFGIVALVKLKFVPAAVDTDLVLIDNLDALKLMIQSIKFGEAGDRANATAYEIDAIRELNRQLEDSIPDQQVAIAIEPFARTGIGRMRCF